jgi:hypothetical protein
LARHERNFDEAARAPLSVAELLGKLGESAELDGRSREDAIACYLAGGEGWKDAVKLLGGTFADGGSGLKERKAD